MVTSAMMLQLLSNGPFVIKMVDGRTYEIVNPDSFFVGKSSVRLELNGDCVSSDSQNLEQIQLEQIDRIEPFNRSISWTVRKIQMQNELGPTQPVGYLLAGIAAYFLLSILTVPFAGIVWFGELPILALIQIPVVQFAQWLRTAVVMRLMVLFGMSTGSYSPDSLIARPYGMHLCHLILGLTISAILFRSKELHRPDWRWAFIVLCLMILNDLMILTFGKCPWNGFTMY